ncbi:hypothetical protein EGW08_021756 [Elysia chlorotica]|uniref:DUF7869 domain-containing protein n=1 Tax=Elysia chlorotica TaxID=188477 RepID=A0A3S1AS25_ELYCH|nr:hypothetical protein EGW08_021756 [Elysia chlorotica]
MATPLETSMPPAFDDFFEFASPSKGKKLKRKATTPAKDKVKAGRHSGIGKMPSTKCQHDEKSFCQAALVTKDDMQFNFEKFYSSSSKIEQDATLLRLMTINDVKRKRVKVEEDRQKQRSHSVAYCIKKKDSAGSLVVCKQTFMGIFGVSKDRLTRISSYYVEHGEPRPERRGGNRQANKKEEMRNAIKEHVSQFMCRASHYGRKDQAGRKYLPSDLSVAQMHRLFQEQRSLQTSYALYYSVFKYDFNLGFGHPATDVCSTCVSLKNRFRNLNVPQAEKAIAAAEFFVHRRRARAFYDLLNDVNNASVTVCFDIMENLVLPKSPIGQTYYSRQLYMYVMGIVRHHGKASSQGKDDVSLYVWCEWDNRKDSNMVASALHHFLTTKMVEPLLTFPSLRLFSDACPGQNRNSTMLGMLFALSKKINVPISHHFPVRGHSFLPADRVFGRIDQQLKQKATVMLPQDYYSVLAQHGELLVYGKDWEATDYKSAVASVAKQTGKEFKITEAKILQINPGCDKVSFKSTYTGQPCLHTVLKRGKKWSNMKPCPLPHETTVSDAKKNDVKKLLDALEADTPTRQFYDSVLTSTTTTNADSDDE